MKRPVADPFASSGGVRKPVPFEFALELLAPLSPYTRPMFGCTAVYVDERIVLVLRERGDSDDGVWVVYDVTREAEVLKRLPRLRPIDVFEGKVKGWKKLSVRDPKFEDDVTRVCSFISEGDDRFGKVPKPRRKKAKK